ncbi:MAG: CPCC family cysteine-rich protein [Marinobacter sp.]|nr:CPCC family cysteine-rich protein [Marinobacter sp.]
MFSWIKRAFRHDNTLQWDGPVGTESRAQCPCCDYITLAERGSYQICPVCFWEDDGQDLDELDVASGPNRGMTLREGRRNFEAFGACEQGMVRHVLRPDQRRRYRQESRPPH